MSKWFDKEMKRLMKKFDEMFKKMMSSSRKQNLKPDKDSKKFEKEEPGFLMKVEMFDLTMSPKGSDRVTISEPDENKKSEVVGEEKEKDKPGKLALKRFKEKNKEDEE